MKQHRLEGDREISFDGRLKQEWGEQRQSGFPIHWEDTKRKRKSGLTERNQVDQPLKISTNNQMMTAGDSQRKIQTAGGHFGLLSTHCESLAHRFVVNYPTVNI